MHILLLCYLIGANLMYIKENIYESKMHSISLPNLLIFYSSEKFNISYTPY